MKKPKTVLVFDRKVILKAARSHLQQVDQWAEMLSWGRAAHYAAKAEACIELVEVADCGSVGGFDVGQDRDGVLWTLDKRLKWLEAKR